MLLDGTIAVWLIALSGNSPTIVEAADVRVFIDAPAMWAPDTQLVLELGTERFEVTGRGHAVGVGPVLVRLVDTGSCRVLARFEAAAGRAYAIKLGDVPAPTVIPVPPEATPDSDRAFSRIDFSGCNDSRTAITGTASVAAILAVAAVVLITGSLYVRRRSRT